MDGPSVCTKSKKDMHLDYQRICNVQEKFHDFDETEQPNFHVEHDEENFR